MQPALALAAQYLDPLRFHLTLRQTALGWMFMFHRQHHPEWFGDGFELHVAQSVRNSRIKLAVEAYHLYCMREWLRADPWNADPDARAVQRLLNGALAELSTAVVSYGIDKYLRRGILWLPAVPQWDRLAGAANSDVGFFDVEHRLGIGAQVKSTRLARVDQVYDPARVVRINAAEDFEEWITRTSTVGSALVRSERTPAPGAAALRFLSTASSRGELPPTMSISQFEAAKAGATMLLHPPMSDAGAKLRDVAQAATQRRAPARVRPRRPRASNVRALKQADRASLVRCERALCERFLAILDDGRAQ